ncbi:unnamed protein product [Penicillium bialowiezense]
MAPTEESILGNFLLSPAPLPTFMSLQKFTELFPKRLRSHPHIRTLYRELQQVREHDMDRVNENIDNEIKQGEQQRAELRKATQATGIEASNPEEQREMDLDVHLFGQAPAVPADYHSMASLLAEMEIATANIEHEIAGIDEEAAGILEKLNTTVGDMSDLRYGKLQGPAGTAEDMASQAIQGLQNLEDACYKNRDKATATAPSTPAQNPLPTLLQTPSGLALLELQGTINVPGDGYEDTEGAPTNIDTSSAFETPIGKLMFPDYSALNPDDTKWMKRAYLYVGRYQRMTGEVKKLPLPLAVVQKRTSEAEELEVVEIVRYKIFFKNRPEPVTTV